MVYHAYMNTLSHYPSWLRTHNIHQCQKKLLLFYCNPKVTFYEVSETTIEDTWGINNSSIWSKIDNNNNLVFDENYITMTIQHRNNRLFDEKK